MSFAILRTSKITASNVGGANAHNTRSMEVPNADPEQSSFNYQLAGTKSLKNDIENRLNDAGISKTRKNAVLGIEHMMTASPEYFENDKDNKKFYEFENECMNWLKERYGEKNIINVHAHFDEHTPHLHAIVTPVVEKDVKWKNGAESGIKRENRLSARDFINGAKAMSQMQDSFAQHMKKNGLGLDRGQKGSKAKHTTIKKFYGYIEKANQIKNKDLNIKLSSPNIQIKEKSTFEKSSTHQKTEQTKVDNAVSESNKFNQNSALEASKILNAMQHTLLEESRLKSKLEAEKEILIQKLNTVQKENRQLKENNSQLQQGFSELKDKYKNERNLKIKWINYAHKHITKPLKGKEFEKNLKWINQVMARAQPLFEKIKKEEKVKKQANKPEKQIQNLPKKEKGNKNKGMGM